MPDGRVVLAYLLFSFALAVIIALVIRYFWQKALVPDAKVTKWQYDDVKKQSEEASKILRGKKK